MFATAVWLEFSEENSIIDALLTSNGEGIDYLNIKGGGSLHPYTNQHVDKANLYLKQVGNTIATTIPLYIFGKIKIS